MGQLTHNQKRNKITLRDSKFDCFIDDLMKHCIKYKIHMWPSMRKHVLSKKEFSRGFEVGLKPFRTWNIIIYCYGSNTLWKPTLKMSGEKHSPSLCWPCTCWQMRDSISCYNFFCRNVYFCHVLRYWFIYGCGKIKRYNTCETSPKLCGETLKRLRM